MKTKPTQRWRNIDRGHGTSKEIKTKWNMIIGKKKRVIGCWVQVHLSHHKEIAKSLVSEREEDGVGTSDREDVVES